MLCVMSKPYITLIALHRATGLPEAWLRREALAGRIPHLRVGRRLMFNLDAVRASIEGLLTERAKREGMNHGA